MRLKRLLWLLLLLCPLSYASRVEANKTETKTTKTVQEPAPAPRAEQNDAPKVDPAKRADILKLMEITGAKASVTQITGEMEKSMRPLMTQSLPNGDYREKLIELFFVKFRSKFDVERLIDLEVPIYDKYLTDEDIKGLIQFYQTPLGQKAITALPKLSQESMQMGQRMGETVGKESIMEVLEEHPELQKQMEEAAKTAKP